VLRRLPTVTLSLVAVFAVMALAACSSAAAPGWTYAPAASASAAASGAASGGPSGSPAASASAAASVAPSTAPSGSAVASPSAAASGGAVGLTVTAPQGAATAGFDPKTLDGPANTAFTVTFDNQDTTTSPHNWTLKDPNGTKVQIGGDTSFFSGPAKREYQIPALAPGAYSFLCEVHPAVMTGTLTIK
jgi:plastocyanin